MTLRPMSLRAILFSTLTAFAITLAIILGQRLSSDALALLLGVALGCAISLPSHYFLFRLAQRTTYHPPLLSPIQTPTPPLPPLPIPRSFVFIDNDSAAVRPSITLD